MRVNCWESDKVHKNEKNQDYPCNFFNNWKVVWDRVEKNFNLTSNFAKNSLTGINCSATFLLSEVKLLQFCDNTYVILAVCYCISVSHLFYKGQASEVSEKHLTSFCPEWPFQYGREE